jgi:TRAP-type C4-dicarboxylate transport system permease large subunit
MSRWLSAAVTLPLFAALSAALIYGNAEKVHSRLLWLGETTFGGYFQIQRDPEPPPNCDALFQGAPPAQEDDELGALFGDEGEVTAEEEAARARAASEARERARAQCEERARLFTEVSARITPAVRFFRAIEGGVGGFVSVVLSHFKHILVMIILLGALAASARGDQIALRHPDRRGAYALAELTQALAFAAVGASMWAYRAQVSPGEERTLNALWLIGLGALTALHLTRLALLLRGEVRRHDGQVLAPGFGGRALLSVPLFATMALIAAVYFWRAGHPAGLAIELTKLTEHATLYVNVALYVWVGMLLKQSPLTHQAFDVLRPWRLAPAVLTGVVVVLSAIPTAYSGASGIFVIAAGALIYEELRAAGARRQLALAATAMSGSLGVVLSPCLLIVIIASLNKQVTTDDLYGWGRWVFVLTALLFVLATLSQRERGRAWVGASAQEGWAGTRLALRALAPSVGWVVVVLLFYRWVLSTRLDEHSAPMVLPVVLLVLLALSRRASRGVAGASAGVSVHVQSFRDALSSATSEAGPHIGALLVLMGMSIGLGGVIERGELMSVFPQVFSSVWVAMGATVLILVVVGMLMDPYGAVILVSATIADVAYRSGIDAIHFWVVVMVAFELGYLSPPVALNHLLTRQVVGDDEVDVASVEGGDVGGWGRYERLLLPVVVMGVALLLVAFVPLMFY